MRCGNCKGDHEAVSTVKLCYETRKCVWQVPAAPGYVNCHWCALVHTMADYEYESESAAAEAHAEYLVEQRQERWFEERGGCEEPERERIPF